MILVTGAAGFIGSHLCDFLVEKGFTVCGTYWSGDNFDNIEHLKDKVKFVDCDIRDSSKVNELIKQTKPEMIFHMAAQSFVTVGWKEPLRTLETNIIGTYNLLEAVRTAGIEPIMFIACSSAEYGLNYEDEIPINEKKEFRPSSHYAVGKIGTDMLSYLYFQAYKMKLFRIRFFNTTGPRKTLDVCSDFSKGIAKVEAGLNKQLSVGNLEAVRDFTDVRDSVKALWIIKDKGKYGEVYNICSSRRDKVKKFLDILLKLSKKEIQIYQDPHKKRILDDPIFVGDNTKIKSLGWEPKIPIEQTLSDMLDYWRGRMNIKV